MKQAAKIITTAVVSVILCVSLIVGATFALFTSESNVNIAVSSGSVKVVASVASYSAYNEIDGNRQENFWGGADCVTVADGNVTLRNMIPGDGIDLTITITNESSVSVKYQVSLIATQDEGLFEHLQVSVDGLTVVKPNVTAATDWQIWSPSDGTEKEVNVSIVMPQSVVCDDGSSADWNCTLAVRVNAVQGNANTVNPSEVHSDLAVLSQYDLQAIGSALQQGSMTGKTVDILNDIELVEPFKPIGNEDHPFDGVIDGHGNTIKGLRITQSEVDAIEKGSSGKSYAGLFVSLKDATVRNLVIEDAEITSTSGTKIGILAGKAEGSVTVEGVTVGGSIDAFDAAGGLIGYIRNDSANQSSVNVVIKNCVNEATVKSGNKAAGIVAHAEYFNSLTIVGCVNNGRIVSSLPEGVKDDCAVGGLVGYVMRAGTIDISDCQNNAEINVNMTAKGSKLNVGGIISTAHEGVFTITDVVNKGNIVINYDSEGASTITTAEVGGIAGSGSGRITFTHVQSLGDITVSTRGGTLIGGICGDSKSVAGILSGEKGNSVVNCTITCPVEAIGEYKQYAGALLGGTNTTVVLDGIEIDISLPVYNDAAYGLCGSGAFPEGIKNVTAAITCTAAGGFVGSWDEAGTLTQE